MLPLILTALLAATTTSAVDSPLFGSTWNTTEWFWQSAVVVGDQLYVDGGEFYNQPDLTQDAVTFYSLASTLRVDLSTSWTNATVVPHWYGQNQFQDVRRPNLWYNPDNDRVFRWGGWAYWDNVSYPSSFWSFPIKENLDVTWAEAADFTANGLGVDTYAPFGGASVATDTAWYSLGGSNTTYGTAVQGLVKYDFSNKQWSNESSTDATSSGFLVQGQGTYASNFGDAGFLIFTGGDLPQTETYDYEGGNDLPDMSNIILYDIAKQTWYHQKATGDIPPPRSEFCSVGAPTADKSSFEMFIYGGSTNQTWDWSNPNDDGYLSVYALSLPGFRWFKSNSTTTVRRANHFCQIIGATAANGNSQFLSIGGRQPSSLGQLGAAPDPWASGLGVFDMSGFQWAEFYDSAKGPYTKPDVVNNYYNNDYVKPSFSSPVLAKAFAFTAPAKTTSSGAASTSSPPGGSTNHTGAIVGGVVGGVAVIVLLLVGFFLLRRRRQHKAASAKNAADNQAAYAHSQTHDFKHGGAPVEAPPYQDGGYPRAEKPADSPHQELPGSPPETAELGAGQNTFGSGGGVKRKPVGHSSEGPAELPGS